MIAADRASRGITSLQDSHVFHIGFDFTNVAHGSTQMYRVAVNQGDMLIHGISTWNKDTNDDSGNLKLYWLKIVNREYNQQLMSNFVSMIGTLETDVRTLFRFPSPWFVRNGTYLDVFLRNPTDNELGTLYGNNYTVTTQHVLIGQVFPRGYEATFGEKAPRKQPFILSYFAPLGFQEDTISGGNVLDSANIYPSYQASWPPLIWDFELTSISMDSGFINYANVANAHMLQVIERNTKRTLVNSPCTQANDSGSRSLDAWAAYNISNPTGWPASNSLTHNLPVPVFCKKGSQLTAKLSFNLNYTFGSVGQMSNLNQVANICLMGNKFEDQPNIGVGPFSQPPTYA